MLAVGLMSGTSLDGVDAALLEIRPRGERYYIDLQRFETLQFDPELRGTLAAALPPNSPTLSQIAALHEVIGHAHARAACAVTEDRSVGFVAAHGQTIWHDGTKHVTLQLGNAFVIREAVNATVCYDFRSADCAAGGQGAPLAAWVDALLLADDREDRVALNLGGIANVTLLRAGAPPQKVIAFDTGPANMLLDCFIKERTHGAGRFDSDGALAQAGRSDESLVAAMIRDEYFGAPAPKTTGREYFGGNFLARYPKLDNLSTEDGAATLTELTAASIAAAIESAGFARAHVIVSGGGVHNRALMNRLNALLPAAYVERSEAFGIPADAKEAIAFAVLGYETLRGRSANLPSATGAARRVVLGAIAPWCLNELLDRIAAECCASQ